MGDVFVRASQGQVTDVENCDLHVSQRISEIFKRLSSLDIGVYPFFWGGGSWEIPELFLVLQTLLGSVVPVGFKWDH